MTYGNGWERIRAWLPMGPHWPEAAETLDALRREHEAAVLVVEAARKYLVAGEAVGLPEFRAALAVYDDALRGGQ